MRLIKGRGTHEALTAAIENGPLHLRSLMLACSDYGCGFAVVPQHSGRFVLACDQPTVVLVGDDLDASLGPQAFPRRSLSRFIAKCELGIVISSEVLPALYHQTASVASLLRKHSIIVETRLEQEQAWIEFLDQACPGIPKILMTVAPMGRA